MAITNKNWTFLRKLPKSTNITVIQIKNLNMIWISELGKMTMIIHQLRTLLIFRSMIIKVWIKWKKLSISELFCSIKENLRTMIKLSSFRTKREPLFAFINQELALLEIGRDAKLCITLNFSFTKKTSFWLRQSSIYHIKWFKSKKNKNSTHLISTKMVVMEVTHVDKDEH